MKKFLRVWVIVAILVAILLAAIQFWPVSVDYGESEMFSQGELAGPVDRIGDTLQRCKVYKICYAGDAVSQEDLDYCNELAQARQEEPFEKCAVFEVTFRAPFRDAGSWNPGGVYDWTFYFGQRADGTWHLETYGVA